MATETSQGVDLGLEPRAMLIVDLSIKCVRREYIKSFIICRQISRDGLRTPKFTSATNCKWETFLS